MVNFAFRPTALLFGLIVHLVVLGRGPAAQAKEQRPFAPLSEVARGDSTLGPDPAEGAWLAEMTPTALMNAGVTLRHQTARLLADDTSAHGLLLLWLLAHDASADVQATALHATLLRCPKESRATCAGLLRFFFDEGQADISWEARTALLSEDPDAALQAATKAYKLEVVSLLAGRVGRPQAPDGLWRALRALAQDYEPEVQEAASIVLLDQQR